AYENHHDRVEPELGDEAMKLVLVFPRHVERMEAAGQVLVGGERVLILPARGGGQREDQHGEQPESAAHECTPTWTTGEENSLQHDGRRRERQWVRPCGTQGRRGKGTVGAAQAAELVRDRSVSPPVGFGR